MPYLPTHKGFQSSMALFLVWMYSFGNCLKQDLGVTATPCCLDCDESPVSLATKSGSHISIYSERRGHLSTTTLAAYIRRLYTSSVDVGAVCNISLDPVLKPSCPTREYPANMLLYIFVSFGVYWRQAFDLIAHG